MANFIEREPGDILLKYNIWVENLIVVVSGLVKVNFMVYVEISVGIYFIKCFIYGITKLEPKHVCYLYILVCQTKF